MWHGKAGIIICLLIPVLIMGQTDHDPDDLDDDATSARFGLGGIGTLHAAWRAVCDQRCPQSAKGRFFGSTKAFCALICDRSASSSNGALSPSSNPDPPKKPSDSSSDGKKPQEKPSDDKKPQEKPSPSNPKGSENQQPPPNDKEPGNKKLPSDGKKPVNEESPPDVEKPMNKRRRKKPQSEESDDDR